MKSLRRYNQPGNVVFTTHVTFDRRPILMQHRDLLTEALGEAATETATRMQAHVILPDHLHLLTQSQVTATSDFVRLFKIKFAGRLRSRLGLKLGRLWQNRFWDHIIRDENDLRHHIHYIHYNPVKHGLVSSPFDWELSSIHAPEFAEQYYREWGMKKKIVFDREYGE